MNYPADSTAKLCQGGKGRYVDREGVPVDNCSREKLDLRLGLRMDFLLCPILRPNILGHILFK